MPVDITIVFVGGGVAITQVRAMKRNGPNMSGRGVCYHLHPLVQMGRCGFDPRKRNVFDLMNINSLLRHGPRLKSPHMNGD